MHYEAQRESKWIAKMYVSRLTNSELQMKKKDNLGIPGCKAVVCLW